VRFDSSFSLGKRTPSVEHEAGMPGTRGGHAMGLHCLVRIRGVVPECVPFGVTGPTSSADGGRGRTARRFVRPFDSLPSVRIGLSEFQGGEGVFGLKDRTEGLAPR
jgi:hypothetical protein